MHIITNKQKKYYDSIVLGNEISKILTFAEENFDKFSFGYSKAEHLSVSSIILYRYDTKIEIELTNETTLESFKKKLTLY